MTGRKIDLLFLAGLAAGTSYFFIRDMDWPFALLAAWKGAGVACFALWAALHARGIDGWLIAAALACGALGDVLIESDLIQGAIGFLAGHVFATMLYLRNRRRPLLQAVALAMAVSAVAFLLPDQRSEAPGIALYALGLGIMAGTAWISRFPRATVGIGALLFVVSDLFLFARMGPLAGSLLPDLTVWPFYFAGQALIAWGVVTSLRREGAA
jgi:uncharacterized membrane protein YhhN